MAMSIICFTLIYEVRKAIFGDFITSISNVEIKWTYLNKNKDIVTKVYLDANKA